MRPDPRQRLIRGALLALLFLSALLPRLYHVRSPFMNFADHNSAMYGIFARNTLDRGLLETRFGQVRNLGPVEPEKYRYFAHHAPTISLLTAGSFLLFGVSEAAARLLPILASALTALLVALLGARLLGRGWGLLAGFLFALSPGAIYFGRMLAHEAFVAAFGLACLYAWRRHCESEDRRWWIACLGLLSATILIDWPGAYLVAAIAAGSLLDPAARPRWIRMTLHAGAVAAATLAAVVAQILWVMGSFEDLREAFDTRVFSTPELQFTWWEYLDGIRYELFEALHRAGFWMAVAGAGLALVLAIGRKALRVEKEPVEAWRGIAALAAAILIFGLSHHVLFTNAVHFNRHVVYYLLPGMAILMAAGPALLCGAARRWAGRGLAVALALVVAGTPLGILLLDAPRQARAYFNGDSFTGWALMGQAMNRLVPTDGTLLSTGGMTHPQFLFYLWRARRNNLSDPLRVERARPGEILLRDMNVPMTPEMEEALAGIDSSETLNFRIYDMGSRSEAPAPPFPRPEAEGWSLEDVEFGGQLHLTMHTHAPLSVPAIRPGAIPRYLGLGWTPELAASRTVHASILWERLEGEATDLKPEYALVLTGSDEKIRAPMIWRLARKARNLGTLAPGETARHELDWLITEWLPAGTYELQVKVRRSGRLVRPVAGEEVLRHHHASLGTVTVGRSAGS